MTQLARFVAEDGTHVYVETADDEPEIVPVARLGDGIIDAAQRLESGVDRIAATAHAVVRRLREAPRRPDEVTVELGVRFNASVGMVIAKSEAEGQLRITAVWRAGNET